jgi:hypothetical protein
MSLPLPLMVTLVVALVAALAVMKTRLQARQRRAALADALPVTRQTLLRELQTGDVLSFSSPVDSVTPFARFTGAVFGTIYYHTAVFLDHDRPLIHFVSPESRSLFDADSAHASCDPRNGLVVSGLAGQGPGTLVELLRPVTPVAPRDLFDAALEVACRRVPPAVYASSLTANFLLTPASRRTLTCTSFVGLLAEALGQLAERSPRPARTYTPGRLQSALRASGSFEPPRRLLLVE